MTERWSNQLIDLTGKRFACMVVISRDTSRNRVHWNVRCDCGKTRSVRSCSLTSGRLSSLGCAGRKHGHHVGGIPSRTCRSWSSMKARCLNPNAPDYQRYGGAGISICQQWQDSFETFLEDMGERPAGMTLDRIDNDGDYTPENCRWATPTEQQRNRKCSRMMTHKGKTLHIHEWAERSGIPYKTLSERVRRGMTDYEALTKSYTPRKRRS